MQSSRGYTNIIMDKRVFDGLELAVERMQQAGIRLGERQQHVVGSFIEDWLQQNHLVREAMVEAERGTQATTHNPDKVIRVGRGQAWTRKMTSALTEQIWVRLTDEEMRLLEDMTLRHDPPQPNRARSLMVRRLIREAAARDEQREEQGA